MLELQYELESKAAKWDEPEVESSRVEPHTTDECDGNSSSISHFVLLALADTRQLQLLHFCLFLGISLAALLGNGLIISAVACGHLLHTPMFFFLLNLALTDLGSICTTVPTPKPCTIPWGHQPPSISSPSLDVALSVLYSVAPPALNPLIYSLRNQELKAEVQRLMTGWFQKH
ncbi:hypothetical protein DUI87_35051 [Hirundo rustica rustica]|uniref:G-protein coupled receptors family 1 profile domain-containing protein n=1 Tax=Hirundo rustica rustica TaxID=333673 RepID=A0A3M0IGC2_HIRRU|nr:hypothetical protein DUI87_35051 [Hirundo rustica rustica]